MDRAEKERDGNAAMLRCRDVKRPGAVAASESQIRRGYIASVIKELGVDVDWMSGLCFSLLEGNSLRRRLYKIGWIIRSYRLLD